MKKIFLNSIFIILLSPVFCQFSDYTETVHFNVSTDRENYRSGESIKILFDFNIKNKFHIYSSDINKAPIQGETYTEYYDSTLFDDIQHIVEPETITKFDPNFNQKTSYHEGKFQISQLAVLNDLITSGNYKVEGTLYATACDPIQCIRVVEDFYFNVNVESGEKREEFVFGIAESSNELKRETDKGLIPFILFSLGMGFLALLTPCVFPMIPITISFFTKLGEQAQSKEENSSIKSTLTPLSAATIYALGIIVIFTLLGLVLALTLGASGAQQIAQNPWINLLIGLLFIFFAFSLFGYYE